MKFAKIKIQSESPKSHWGICEGDRIDLIDNTPFNDFAKTGASVAVKDAEFLAPVIASTKVVCVGWNYLLHTKGDKKHPKLPDEPALFLKPLSTVVGHNGYVEVPASVAEPKFEAEFAVVIGKKSKNLPYDESALDCIKGYTAANDFTARELLAKDKIFTRAKGFDTFLPLGPYVETDFDYQHKSVQTYVNGTLKQDGTTNHMIFSLPFILHHITSIMTLEEGDIVLTGTPEDAQVVEDGDHVEVRVQGLSPLSITIKRI